MYGLQLSSLLLVLGAACSGFGFWRLSSALGVRARDGSEEAGYQTPEARWGFVVLDALMLLCGYVLLQAHGAWGH